ncbi:MAG TPA: TetR family transcriptional regulator [Gryllotalpicola sp.]
MTEIGAGIRDAQRGAVRGVIAQRAMELFLERGYEETTVDDVAAAVGVSVRTVFRYVASKEEMVVGAMGDLGLDIADRIATSPLSSRPWAALVAGVEGFAHDLESGGDAARARSRLLASTPQLRGALAEKRQRWQDDITPAVAQRLEEPARERELCARAMVAAVLACLDVAVARWAFDAHSGRLIPLFRTAVEAVGDPSGK